MSLNYYHDYDTLKFLKVHLWRTYIFLGPTLVTKWKTAIYKQLLLVTNLLYSWHLSPQLTEESAPKFTNCSLICITIFILQSYSPNWFSDIFFNLKHIKISMYIVHTVL